MTTTVLENRPSVSPTVLSLLGSLRRRIRAYVWVEGLASAAVWLGVAFWGTLLIDWFFEPPAAVRGVLLAAVAVVLVAVLMRLVFRRAFVRLGDRHMAMLIERRFPQLDDGLLTAVVLTAPGADTSEYNWEMLAHTCHEAAERIGDVELRRIFNPVPLRRAVAGAILLGLSIAVFAGLSVGGGAFAGVMGVWARRCLLFSNDPWPRRAELVVEGFHDGVAKVARGANFDIVAKASTEKELPKTVQVRYRVEGGRRDRKLMTRVGTADPARDAFQEYNHTFEGILAPIRLDVVGEVEMGRDVRVPNLRIEVVDSPTVVSPTLRCRYPAYMERQPRDLPVTGVMQIPRGTEVTLLAQANKDLLGVAVECAVGQESVHLTELRREDLDGPREFRYTVASLDEDTTLLLTLSDTDNITAREPVRLTLAAVTDEPPQLTARLEGIGAAITPQARLPAVGQITDDYGIGEAWFEYAIDEQEPAFIRLVVPAVHPTTLPLTDVALEVRDLKLTAGQKLLVGLKAADRCDLGDAPNVGNSERWLLDVVTPEQLRALLEARELVLRQRFEAIIEEVTETRDVLLRVEFGAAEAGEAGEPAVDTGAEPGDAPESVSPERQLALRTLRVQRALTNCSKNTHETLSVAEGFDDIRLQLVNNRIDTEELIARLKQGIADPLHQIVEEMYPRLQTRLEQLDDTLDDEQLGPRNRDLARQEANAILLEMRRVLDRMIELESFNEAVELLRTIIRLQEELEGQTKERHKERIRELLGEDEP